MYFRFLVLLICLCSLGCSRQYSDFFPYHDDGRLKPVVALIPVIDSSSSGLPWDLSREFTSGIRSRMMRNGSLFLIPQEAVDLCIEPYSKDELLSCNFSYAKLFPNIEYAMVLELIDHHELPYERGKIKPLYLSHGKDEGAVVLQMKMRLKVIDLRQGQPKIILQEIMDSNHMINKEQKEIDYHKFSWGNKMYTATPYGIAHARMVRDIAQRIESMIAAKR